MTDNFHRGISCSCFRIDFILFMNGMNLRIRILVFSLLASLFVVFAIWFGANAHQAGSDYIKAHNSYAEVMSLEERLFNLSNWLFPEQEYMARAPLASDYEEDWTVAEEKLVSTAWIIAIGSLAFVLLTWIIFRAPGTSFIYRGLSLMIVAIAFLVLGIFVPMLEIAAFHTDLTVAIDNDLASSIVGDERVFKGDTVYYYQCKSVWQLIGMLFKSNNLVVGSAILLFSVIFPIVKMLVSGWLIMARKPSRYQKLEKVVGKIGKWSMADVFVAACFLAFLSFYNMNAGVDTEATTLPGLYFFLTYVVLSILSSSIVSIAMRRRSELHL